MATAQSQQKWRDKHRFVKRQLNVVARKRVHDNLANFARTFNLRGKGEAVTFAAFVTEALVQRADYNAQAARMLDDFTRAYHRDREMYSS